MSGDKEKETEQAPKPVMAVWCGKGDFLINGKPCSRKVPQEVPGHLYLANVHNFKLAGADDEVPADSSDDIPQQPRDFLGTDE